MERSAEIREVIERYYQAYQRGDFDAAEGFVSSRDGVLVIGSDPDEWWDADGYNRAMRAQGRELGGIIPVYPGDIRAYREGSVAWAVDRPTFRLEDGTEVQGRLSVVLHREQDAWKVVHLHLSFGVPNEEVLGGELTI